jgi:hypothetical protein
MHAKLNAKKPAKPELKQRNVDENGCIDHQVDFNESLSQHQNDSWQDQCSAYSVDVESTFDETESVA